MERKARARGEDERPAPRRSVRLANKRAGTNPPPTVGHKKHASKEQTVPDSTNSTIPNASAPGHNIPSTAAEESLDIGVEEADAGPAPGLLSEESYLLLRLRLVGRVYPAFDATSRVTIASPMDEQLFLIDELINPGWVSLFKDFEGDGTATTPVDEDEFQLFFDGLLAGPCLQALLDVFDEPTPPEEEATEPTPPEDLEDRDEGRLFLDVEMFPHVLDSVLALPPRGRCVLCAPREAG